MPLLTRPNNRAASSPPRKERGEETFRGKGIDSWNVVPVMGTGIVRSAVGILNRADPCILDRLTHSATFLVGHSPRHPFGVPGTEIPLAWLNA